MSLSEFMLRSQMNTGEQQRFFHCRFTGRVRLAEPNGAAVKAHWCGEPHPTLAAGFCTSGDSAADIDKSRESLG